MTPETQARKTRRSAFVAAGREEFFSHGFAGAVMSNVAARVGGSKTTLWSYFPSKEDLFAAVVDDIVEKYGQALSVDALADEPIESILRRFGSAMMNTVLSEPILNLHRLVTGEAGRFPQIGTMFYERGAKRGKAKLSLFIKRAMDKGELRQGDPDLAARHFSEMCKSGCFQHALLGMVDDVTPDAIASDISGAMAIFMCGWATTQPTKLVH
jgi:TetR/AcrR family transcriptional regulator, mexJK operon transcriptional repressor